MHVSNHSTQIRSLTVTQTALAAAYTRRGLTPESADEKAAEAFDLFEELAFEAQHPELLAATV